MRLSEIAPVPSQCRVGISSVRGDRPSSGLGSVRYLAGHRWAKYQLTYLLINRVKLSCTIFCPDGTTCSSEITQTGRTDQMRVRIWLALKLKSIENISPKPPCSIKLDFFVEDVKSPWQLTQLHKNDRETLHRFFNLFRASAKLLPERYWALQCWPALW